MTSPIETDALVIGAGPVGLFQAFQLGLQGITCHIVDALPHVGGQCAELYAHKPLYDIPALPVCTGAELINRLQQQLSPFNPAFHLGQLVQTLRPTSDGCWTVMTDTGTVWITKTLFIAAGVGAFVPRSLPLEGLASLMNRQVWHANSPLPDLTDHHVVVAGDGDCALQTCMDAAPRAASVTLIHRRQQFQAEPRLAARFISLLNDGTVRFVAGQPTGVETDGDHLVALRHLDADGQEVLLPCDQLIMALGLSPKLGPVSKWGLEIERKQLRVNTENFATSAPGIFAVGDINTYPGKKKLILCGFHEATLAAFGAAALLWPDEKPLLQYTTTSTTLHRRLGLI
jgi:thioredoxin reductase (NADPH)